MQPVERPVIGFLTDFGFDGAAATCRAVMLGICPNAQIVDISHSVRKYAIRDGAFLLRAALPYFPIGVHVGVVDPGVGTARRPIAVRTRRGDRLIGPDNGLLIPAAEALGGIVEARELVERELWLPNPSTTFHGRDIFSPVAAHVAAGLATFEAVGPAVPTAELVRLPDPPIRVEPGGIETEIAYVDSFGNLRLGGTAADLRQAFGGPDGTRRIALELDTATPTRIELVLAPSFGHVGPGAGVLYVDSSGGIAAALNQDNLAARIGAAPGTPVRLLQR